MLSRLRWMLRKGKAAKCTTRIDKRAWLSHWSSTV